MQRDAYPVTVHYFGHHKTFVKSVSIQLSINKHTAAYVRIFNLYLNEYRQYLKWHSGDH